MNTDTHNTLKTFVAAATLVVAFATGVQAADVTQVHVSYADLNLHTSAGAAVLNHRITVAAEQVCGPSADRELSRRARFDACKTRAIADALAAVKSSEVRLASLK